MGRVSTFIFQISSIFCGKITQSTATGHGLVRANALAVVTQHARDGANRPITNIVNPLSIKSQLGVHEYAAPSNHYLSVGLHQAYQEEIVTADFFVCVEEQSKIDIALREEMSKIQSIMEMMQALSVDEYAADPGTYKGTIRVSALLVNNPERPHVDCHEVMLKERDEDHEYAVSLNARSIIESTEMHSSGSETPDTLPGPVMEFDALIKSDGTPRAYYEYDHGKMDAIAQENNGLFSDDEYATDPRTYKNRV